MPGHLFSYAIEENSIMLRLQIVIIHRSCVNFSNKSLLVERVLLNCNVIQTNTHFMQLPFVLH